MLWDGAIASIEQGFIGISTMIFPTLAASRCAKRGLLVFSVGGTCSIPPLDRPSAVPGGPKLAGRGEEGAVLLQRSSIVVGVLVDNQTAVPTTGTINHVGRSIFFTRGTLIFSRIRF